MFLACDRPSVETVTLRKYVMEFEQMRKFMIDFLRKFQGLGMKIA